MNLELKRLLFMLSALCALIALLSVPFVAEQWRLQVIGLAVIFYFVMIFARMLVQDITMREALLDGFF
ncbi:hypothetical protein [Chloroflexus sp.]|uniref:hypothetical protein n=1 Tax=Chloroflexus sp. TaxID=1904827 RepID=UPI0026357A27|nr:hypothetical protein [uncultured Chloroflexus sp.]